MTRTRLLVIVALTAAAGVAVAGVALGVSYDFAAGAKSVGQLHASIDAVELGRDVPLAVTGEATVGLTLEVTELNEEGGATVRATFGEVEAMLLGEAQDAASPAPMVMQVDERGALVGLESGQGAQMDLFGSGGVPLELVVLMACIVEMPAEQVGVGESWAIERSQQVPEVGEIKLRTESRITSISETEVTVLTSINASLPDFTTANPMQAGEVTIGNGVLTIADMKRVVDAQSGLIRSVEAGMVFDGTAAMGPIPPLPLRVESSFSITPEGAEQDG